MGNALSLVAVGLSHKTASLTMRERVSVSGEALPAALQHVGTRLGNGVILSTCNRTEIYFVAEPDRSIRACAMDLFRDVTGSNHHRLEHYMYYHTDESAARHLHRVASGMDSMILGEAEILRQVRLAMSASFESGFLTVALDRLFHSALRAGRRLHSETFLGKHERSVATAVVTLARGVLGDVSDCKVLVLGAGDAGAMTIRTMLREGIRDIRVANRTYDRAVNLAEHTGTVPIPFDQVAKVLPDVDIVICATASPLLSRALCPTGSVKIRGPKVLVDIGVPRNIDPTVGDIPGVALFDMDDLVTVCPASPESKAQDLANAEAILEAEIDRFMSWWRSSHAVPTIAALEDAVEEARRRELAKTLRRVPSLDDSQREALEALTKAIVKKVLHQPITRLKLHGDDEAFITLGRELFGLESCEHGHNGVRSAPVNGKRIVARGN